VKVILVFLSSIIEQDLVINISIYIQNKCMYIENFVSVQALKNSYC